MLKKFFIFAFFYIISANSFSADSEVLMRMYERLELIRLQMQQLTEENEQLNNKIIELQGQQDRLYQDLSKKIKNLEDSLETKISNSKIKSNIPKNIVKDKVTDDSNSIMPDVEIEIANIKKDETSNTTGEEKLSVIPKDENELDLAQPYINNNFKKKLPEYELKSEIELYRAAFQLVKDKKYLEAIDVFNAFLYLFQDSNYAANAQYWLSESIYASGDYRGAMINFAKVVEKYPSSSKIADAKLKIGYCYYAIKKWKEARFIFGAILKDYPNTSLSLLADKKIKSMDVEGR
tara:strand:- start:56 stop:931 length:876 start_codon:yes stop_codon:yes gene_type:complete